MCNHPHYLLSPVSLSLIPRSSLSPPPPPPPSGEMGYSRPASQLAHFYTHPLPSRATTPFGGQRSPSNTAPERDNRMALTTHPPATPLPTTPTPARTLDQ